MSDTGTSISETIAALDTPPPEEKVGAAPQIEIPEAVPTAEDTVEPEGATDSETVEDEPELAEGEEPVLLPLDPPRFWDAEDKKSFSELTRAEQEKLLKYSKVADTVTAQKLEQAETTRKAAAAETAKITQLSGIVEQTLTEAKAKFANRWDNVDWNSVADQYGVEAAFKLRNDYETEQATVQRLETAKSEVEKVQTAAHVSARYEQLKTVAPDLTDDKLGADRQMKLVQYLAGFGVPSKVIIERASAQELAIGYKAYLYDQGLAKATALVKQPKPAVTPSKVVVKPTASVSRGTTETAKIKSLEGAFAKDPSIKNLVALQEAKGE